MKHDLTTLKDLLRIPDIWQRLGLLGTPGRNCRSPFRADKSPSFSVYDDGRRWKDFGTSETGDAIDFIAQACHVGLDEATLRFLAMAGVAGGSGSGTPFTHARAQPAAATPGGGHPESLLLPPLHAATPEEIAAIAENRGFAKRTVDLAQRLRTLVFGVSCGEACWILTDAERKIAEARRVDGQPFPAMGGLAARKAHTLRGSTKAWPVGSAVLRRQPSYRALMLVEGGPDYLAALDLCLTADVYDVLPIAMLGRSAGARIDPSALALLAGRRVRIYPHVDADGGGNASAQVWAAQLHAAGCAVDIIHVSELATFTGPLPQDLNEVVRALDPAHPSQLQELSELIP